MSRTARSLVILGSGGAAREVVQLLRACPQAAGGDPVAVAGFLDDDPARAGTAIDGVPVLGPTTEAAGHATRGALLLACVGNPGAPASRQRLVDRLGLPAEVWATVVHPLASVSPDSTVGAGSVLHAGVVLTAAVIVGRHVYVMPHVVLTHDGEVGDAATFGAGVRLAGGVSVGAAAYLGSGALVREHRRIGAGAVVGMGSVVLRDVPPGETWAGNPARPLSSSPAPLMEASL
ncbi:acetyltransferase [Geodermatophilus sp. SYSU D00804]